MTAKTTTVIDLNDVNVRVSQGSKLLLQSPGYALVKDRAIDVGDKAFGQARLHPRQAYNQFWYRLNLEPLTHSGSTYRHNADLAYAHMSQIAEGIADAEGEAAEVIFAVPGHYRSEQLSLLLGIAQKVPFKVVGLVDAAVAAAATVPLSQASLLLDIQLHQAMITQFTVADRVKRRSVDRLSELGLLTLQQAWVQQVADAFIEQCRFDPLHNAATEQALYRLLPQWLEALSERDEVLLEVESAGKFFQARLLQKQVVERARPSYQKLVRALEQHAADNSQVLISSRVAALPGLTEVLPDHQIVAAGAVAQGCEQHAEFICSGGDALSFVTALPVSEQDKMPVSDGSTAVTDNSQATHILYGSRAFSVTRPLYAGLLNDGSFAIERDAHRLSSLSFSIVSESAGPLLRVQNGAAISVNGHQAEVEMRLGAGDLIVVDGAPVDRSDQLHMIREIQDGPQ